MKTGIELIAEERREQIEKHGRTLAGDVITNTDNQLSAAASILATKDWKCYDEEEVINDFCPTGWDEQQWAKMVKKPHNERLIIAGALIAAELDRLIANNIQK